MLRYSSRPDARTSSRPLRFLILKGLDCFELIIRVGEVRERKEIVIIRRNFLLRESTEITVITIILIYIVLRTGKIIIMLLGGGYTELLWIIMGITGISVE